MPSSVKILGIPERVHARRCLRPLYKCETLHYLSVLNVSLCVANCQCLQRNM